MKSDIYNKGNRLRAKWLYRDKEGYSMLFPPTSYYSRLSPFTLGYHPYPTEKAESIQGNCGVLSVAPWGKVALAAINRIALPAPYLFGNLQPCIPLIYSLLPLSLFHQGCFRPSCLSSSCILCCLTISKKAVSVLASWIVT